MTAGTRRTTPRDLFIFGIDMDSLGGAQRVFHLLSQGFAERGHRVELVSINPAAEPFTYIEDRAYRQTTLYPVPPGPRPPVPKGLDRLRPSKVGRHRRYARATAAARLRLDELVAEVESGYMIIGSPWAAHWLEGQGPLPNLRTIGQYHQSYESSRNTPHYGLIKRCYPKLGKSVFLCEDDAEAFRAERLPNAEAIPNPLTFEPGRCSSLDRPRVLGVGRLDRGKRFDLMVTAFAKASASAAEPWELHILGDGPQRAELQQHVERLGVADRVVLRGAVRDVRPEYTEASVFALSSEHEGRPLVLAEAAACGVPSVSFDVSGGIRDLVVDGTTGLLVEPGDVDAFAGALTRLMNEPPLRREMGAAALEHVAPYRMERVLDRWEELFEELDR